MWSTWDRLTAVSTYGPPGSEEDDELDSGWDFSGLGNPGAMRDFMTACDYCLSDWSDDSHNRDNEGCGPSRECFHVDLGGHDEGNHLGMPEGDDPPRPAPRVDILRELAVVPVPAGGQDTHLEQIREMQAKLDEDAGQLVQLRQNIEQEWAGRALAREARHQAQDVQRRIAEDARARLPRLLVGSARTWLQRQYYSKRCRSHPPPRGGVSRENLRISWRMLRSDGPRALPPEGKGTPWSIAPRLPDSCGKPRSTPGARGTQRLQPWVASATSTTAMTVEPASTRRCAEAATPSVGDATTAGRIGAPRPNHPVRKLSAGPYDGHRSRPSSEPRLPSPSTRGETRPELWIADYRLACQLGGMDDDNLIIRNIPLFLSDAAGAWLEHLPPAQISNWDDLVKAFVGNFKGTYVRPGNSWDLRSCRQQLGESLRDYIRWFSKQRTELPNIIDSDVIGAFLAGTTCRDLVSKLGRKTPTRASELMDIATKFASGQEAVEAIFRKDKQPQGR
jgi:hypothetical protein